MKNILNFIKKIKYFINTTYYTELSLFIFLIFFSMLLEVVSIGLIFPLVSLILNQEFLNDYTLIKSFFEFASPLKFLNNSPQFNLITGVLTIFLITILVKNIFTLAISYFRANLIFKIQYSLRRDTLKKFTLLPFQETLQIKNAEYITLMNQIGGIVTLIESSLILITEFLLLLGIIIFLIFFDKSASISVILIICFFSIFLMKVLKKKILFHGEQRRASESSQFFYLQNIISGIKEIKLTNTIDFFFNHFNDNTRKALISNKKFNIYSQFPRIYLEILMAICIVFFLIYGTYNSNDYSTVLSSAAVFLASAVRAIPSLGKIIGSYNTFKYYQPVLDKIFQTLGKFDIMKIIKEDKFEFNKKIILKNLEFKYSKEIIFKNVNLEIYKGDKVGFFGESGSGKSTLINIICGLLSSNSGDIFIDEKKTAQNYLINNLALVSQNPFFVNETIKYNLCFGKKITDMDISKMEKILKIVELSDVVNNLDDKMDTVIGENGTRLSGGQLQRLSIARALYQDPNILILDEATNALDPETQEKLLNNIFLNYKDKTILIISHDNNVTKRCEKIFKIQNKSIIETSE